MKNLQLIRPIAFIDIETTGLSKQEDRIVEISITKVHLDGKEEILNSLINPEKPISHEATKIHGIRDEDVKGKPSFKEFALEVSNFIENCDLCGFNIIGFDLPFLEAEFKRVGIDYSNEGRKVIDVMRIYHKLEPRDLSSAHLKYCGSALENAHGAVTDVKATIDILDSQLEKHEDLPKTVSELHEFCNPQDPSWIDSEGKLSWSNGQAIINFGQYKGRTLEDMQKNNLDYLRWIFSADFSTKVKEIVRGAIEGKFPNPPQ